jgi:hypothetical protein
MANYSQLQTQFLSLLNRRDCTTAQAQTFIQNATQRIQRSLRVPAMENSITVTVASSPSPGFPASLAIPSDLLELINIIPQSTNQGTGQTDFKRLEKTDLTTAMQAGVNVGVPRFYARQGANWILGPAPSINDQIRIDYYQELGALVNPTDANTISIIAPDLIIYGALCYAADFYRDNRKPDWEARYNEIENDLTQMYLEDEENGATAVQRAFGYPDDLNDGWDYYSYGPYGMF